LVGTILITDFKKKKIEPSLDINDEENWEEINKNKIEKFT